MPDLPLVSCIMPTANRESFIQRSVSLFIEQDYPNKELIILDDGEYSVQHLVQELKNIHYQYSSEKRSIGAKRNHACYLSRGSIITHWDDDDWYAKDWISNQVKFISESHADMTGLDELLFYQPHLQSAYKYTYPGNARKWVAGATMAYKKSVWESNPFQDIQIGEDNWFVWNTKCKVIPHKYINGFVSFIHSKNTSPKHVTSKRWESYPVSEILSILK